MTPTITSLQALGNRKVELTWTGVGGKTAKIKRDDGRLGQRHWYFVANTGQAILSAQPLGEHGYRVCDISTGPMDVCSTPAFVMVT